jgi:hypothetical protein
MKADGKAPDLRVILHNLPENRLQLMQVLGRRRAEEKSENEHGTGILPGSGPSGPLLANSAELL